MSTMNRMRWIAAGIALLVSSLAFAGGAGEQGTAMAEEAIVTPTGTFPIVSQPVTLRVFASQDPLVVDYEDNYHTKFLEEKTGVKVQWELVPSQQAAEKLNLLLASGTDLPDVFLQGMGNPVVLKYGQEGVFLPLNDYIDEYGVEIKRIISDMQGIGVDFLGLYTAPDGMIYALPSVNVCQWCQSPDRIWTDSRWLENVGKEIPSTVDEFVDLLRAYKTEDPNGNGEADEIPLMGARTGWGAQVEGFLMYPYIVYQPGGQRLILDEATGDITAAYTQPEWLEGVTFIHSLVEEGLLDPVSLTQTRQEMQVMGERQPQQVGAFISGSIGGFLTLKDDKFKDFEVIPPLEGVYSGEPQVFANKYQPFPDARFAISNTAQYPAVAYRWADYQYAEEPSMLSRYAREGVDWERVNDPDLKGPYGDPATFREISMWGAPTQNSLRQMFMYLSYDMLSGLALPVDSNDRRFIWATPPYAEAGVANSLPRLFILPQEVDEFSELSTTLDTYVDETFARFVTGDLPLSAWDSFQAELRNIGVERFVEMNEAAYKRQYQ